MVMSLSTSWSLLEWYNWLSNQGLEIGRDYCWAWQNDGMAVQFYDPREEIVTRLKLRNND